VLQSKNSPLVRSRLLLIVAIVCLILGLLSFIYWQHTQQRKTVITTDHISEVNKGRITKGDNESGDSKQLFTKGDELVFESEELETENKNTTAAVLKWKQNGDQQGSHLELRTYDGSSWSPWVKSETDQDRPDQVKVSDEHSAIIISKDIHQVQYRFTLHNENGEGSPRIDLSDAQIETIDTSKGPSISNKTLWQKISGSLKIENSAYARSGQQSPPIYSRADWGSPEPNSSPGWDPEYRRLGRSIVHHTATTASADSAAAVRAIWQYHTYSNGWGDIGYNYLVDQQGRIFQGRYFDHNYAESNDVDVVAGHAYGNNYGTTGISALGDFTNVDPSAALLHSIAFTASYKLGAYNIDPGNGSHMIGHRDVGQTACPGARLYPQLPTIRAIATSVFPQYQIKPFSWSYAGQYAYTDETKSTPVNLMNLSRGQRVYLGIKAKNVGTETWSNTGANPVRVGTSRPIQRNSQFCDDTWINCARPASLQESEVNVGETGTFEFWYKVPVTGGRFDEYFTLLAEGNMWMNDPGLHFRTYSEPAVWSYQPVDQYAYTDDGKTTPANLSLLQPGQRVFIGVSARNTGNVTWTNSGANPVRIGTSNARGRQSGFCDPTWINCSRPVSLSEVSVAPGETGTFEFWYKAPSRLGEYREYFTPLIEGIEWMNETGLNFRSDVVHPYTTITDSDRLISNQSLAVGQSISSKDGRFQLVMQGDGNLVLYSPQGPKWNSLTNFTAADKVFLQSDGNLVVYDDQFRAYWNSRTDVGKPTFLNLQNDGNLVLYNSYGSPIWYAGVSGR
jgi:hypothetical protein